MCLYVECSLLPPSVAPFLFLSFSLSDSAKMTHWAIVTTGGHWDECHGGRSKDLEKEEERKRLCDEIKWFLETCVYRFMSIYEHVYCVVFFLILWYDMERTPQLLLYHEFSICHEYL
jgi:hypothetical protein